MCPYCGEELPSADVARCPRCGMVLDEAAAAEAGAEDGPGPGPGPGSGSGPGQAALAAAPPKKKPLVPCPHCDIPIPATAHRCPECGRGIRFLVDDSTAAGARRYKAKVYALVVGGVVLAAVVLVVVSLLTSGGDVKRGQRDPVDVKGFAELDRFLGPKSKATAERRDEFWAKIKGKDIQLAGGRIVKVERPVVGSPALLIKHRSGGDEKAADVRLELSTERLDESKAAEGALVTYQGRCVKYGGRYVVELDDGDVLEVKK